MPYVGLLGESPIAVLTVAYLMLLRSEPQAMFDWP